MKLSHFKKLSAAAIILAFLILTLPFPKKPISGWVFGKELPTEAIVKEVIDGDTIILLQGEKVRYLGINAPETMTWDGNQWIQKPQICGEKAKLFNQRLVEGKKVVLEYDQEKRDAYKRLLAYVRVGEVFVNGELLRQGLALMDVRAPNLKYQKLFVNLQKEARDFHRELWGKIGKYMVSDQEAFNHIGEIGSIRGIIASVRFGREKLYLNFGENVQEDFTCIIYQENLKNFSLRSSSPIKYFFKRRVTVYGVIKNINGPAMIICAPSQIDFLN